MDKLGQKTIDERLEKLEHWNFSDNAIETQFSFRDFKEAFAAMARIAFECESLAHHPEWTNVYNTVTIRLSTHDANGVTEKDFELAMTIDKIMERE